MRLTHWWRKKWGLFRVRAQAKRAMIKRAREVSAYDRRNLFLALAGGAAGATLLPERAKADTAFSAFAFTASGAPTARTMPARLSDIWNVKDYGAVGNNIADDTTPIRAALTAMWASVASGRGGILFFPPGSYRVTDTINLANSGVTTFNTNGCIRGSGREATTIIGNVPNGFIFFQSSDSPNNGPNEISNLRLVNESTWVASGALMIGNSSCLIENVSFSGMINALTPFNSYQLSYRNCTGDAGSDATTGYNGTIGIAGESIKVYNWRSTNPFGVCLSAYGSNGVIMHACGIENCNVGVWLGIGIGWASSCTVSGDILTVGGTIGSAGIPQFPIGAVVYGRGLDLPTWGYLPDDITNNNATYITADHSTDGALTGEGYAGTYRINKTLGAPIVTPIPVYSRWTWAAGPVDILSVTTEANRYGIYVLNAGAGRISSCFFTSTPTEAVDAFGATGYTTHSGLYIGAASALVVEGVSARNNGYAGGIYFRSNAVLAGVTFASCVGIKQDDNVTTATISNGSGSAGTILNVSAITGSSIGIGMSVTGTGVTAGTVITGNAASDGALTGAGGTGTYRVNNSLNLSARTITVHSQSDWVMPTSSFSKAGVQFPNCYGTLPVGISSGLDSLDMAFNDLPGESGANLEALIGMEYTIIDAATGNCSDAACNWGANVTGGGGALKRKVRYNGTNWTVEAK